MMMMTIIPVSVVDDDDGCGLFGDCVGDADYDGDDNVDDVL